jgi:hypothetical protein
VGGVSTAAAVNGVVVRWRVLNGDAGPFRVRVVTLNPGSSGGMYRSYDVIRSSAVENVAARTGLFSKISSFPTRLPIPAGSYVALAGATRSEAFQESSGGAATYSSVDEVGDGLTASGETHNGTVLYNGDIEPDVDGDGYGDVTQDSCPSVATIHEGPCPPGSGGGGSGGGSPGGGSSSPIAASPTRVGSPKIAALSVKPKSFRAKPLGSAAARGGTWGTKLKLNLSATATVTLSFETKKGKRLQTLTKSLGAGPASIAYSGQYRRHGKLVDLPPGSYRVTARAKNAAGTGTEVHATFIVLPPLG